MLDKLREKNKLNKYLLLAIVIALSGILYWCVYFMILFHLLPPIDGRIQQLGGDFYIYYNAAKIFLSGGDIYNNTGFVYPPLAIVLYLPFANLNFNQAFVLMSLLNLFIFAVTILFIIKILHHYNVILSIPKKILLFFVIFLFYPVCSSFCRGQINILILFLITIFYYQILMNKNLSAGISLTIATILKIFPASLVFLGFFLRKIKIVVSYLLTFIACCLISAFLFGIHTNIRFIETVRGFSAPPTFGFASRYFDGSASGMFFKLFGVFNTSESFQEVFVIIWTIVRIIFVLFVLFYLYKISKNEKLLNSKEWEILIFSLMISLTLVLPNYSSAGYAMFLIVPYVLYFFVLHLSDIEELLLLISLILFSYHTHAIYSSTIIGGQIATLIYIISPAMCANILFLFLTLRKITKIKNIYSKLIFDND